MVSRNPVFVEPKESIVSSVEAHFRSDLPHLDSWKGHVSVFVSDLNDERMGAVAFSFGVQLSHYNAVVDGFANWKHKKHMLLVYANAKSGKSIVEKKLNKHNEISK